MARRTRLYGPEDRADATKERHMLYLRTRATTSRAGLGRFPGPARRYVRGPLHHISQHSWRIRQELTNIESAVWVPPVA